MLQRVMPDLMGMKNIMVINDEAHHCYREKPPQDAETMTKTSRATRRKRPTRTTKPPACGSAAWRPSTASWASPA
jgi:hypothetical protein